MNVAQSQPQYITDGEGRKTAVILSMDAYHELLEDLSDLAVSAERRGEMTISHAELLESLRADGLV